MSNLSSTDAEADDKSKDLKQETEEGQFEINMNSTKDNYYLSKLNPFCIAPC